MEKIRDGASSKGEDAAARKGRKVPKHCVFPLFCGSGGSNSRLAKAAGAQPAGQKPLRSGALLEVEMRKKRTLFWCEAHMEVKSDKTHQPRSTFGSSDVEKVHAVVARSTCGSETPFSDHSWKLRCGKVYAIAARSTFGSENLPDTTC